MNPLKLVEAGLSLLDKIIPDGTRGQELKAGIVVKALDGIGSAQKWLAIIFGTSLCLYILLPVVLFPFGVQIPIQWWAIFLLAAFTWTLLGRDLKDFLKLWNVFTKERGLPRDK